MLRHGFEREEQEQRVEEGVATQGFGQEGCGEEVASQERNRQEGNRRGQVIGFDRKILRPLLPNLAQYPGAGSSDPAPFSLPDRNLPFAYLCLRQGVRHNFCCSAAEKS